MWSVIEAYLLSITESYESTEFHQWIASTSGMVVTVLLALVVAGVLLKAVRTSTKAGLVCIVALTLLVLMFPGVVLNILTLMQ